MLTILASTCLYTHIGLHQLRSRWTLDSIGWWEIFSSVGGAPHNAKELILHDLIARCRGSRKRFLGKNPRKTIHLIPTRQDVEPPDITATVLGNWYGHSLIQDDPPASIDIWYRRPMQYLNARARTRAIRGIKPTPYQHGPHDIALTLWTTLYQGDRIRDRQALANRRGLARQQGHLMRLCTISSVC